MKSSKNKIVYRRIAECEICRGLFANFNRRQVVKRCLRRIDGAWRETDAPFIDDWSEEDYAFLVKCLRNTLQTGGAVFGAFADGELKGFASVESKPFGKNGAYRDLTALHVSEELRGKGIGTQLFLSAKAWAKAQGAEKLYISSHSAAESQAFYLAMGCCDARKRNEEHVRREPFDRQLECSL